MIISCHFILIDVLSFSACFMNICQICRCFFFRFKDFDVSVDEEFDSSSSSSITINHDNSRNEDNSSNNNHNVKDKRSEISNSSNRYVHSNGIHFFRRNLSLFPFLENVPAKKTGNIQLPFIGFLFINSLTKRADLYVNDEPPKALPLRPIIRGPYDENSEDDEHAPDTSTVYTEQHTQAKLNCEVDLDIAATVWMHNGQV